ncbi:MAG: sigma 54-interacting transcriptional regulator [Minicystis sp.]
MGTDTRTNAETKQLPPDGAAGAARPPRRRHRLFLYHRDGVETAALEPGVEVVVGRSPTANIAIRDGSLSRRHASFLLQDGKVVVRDLDSMNRTKRGGVPISEADLLPGDEIHLGEVVACVEVRAHADAPSFGLDGHDAFLDSLAAEITRARHFQRRFAVVHTRALSPASGLRLWWPAVREMLRPVDRIGLYGQDEVQILFPEATPEAAEEFARRVVAGSERVAPLACGVAMFPDAGASPEELVEASREAARRATAGANVQRAATCDPRVLPTQPSGGGKIVAESAAMRRVVRDTAIVADATAPVLILGKTGVGKEVIAQMIHARSKRSGPLVAINCAAIPETLLESTLFGHVRGAFTHAVRDAAGVFESADGGTVLLDEIGEMKLSAQAALLRVLEEKVVTRVGSSRPVPVDVRIVAATNKDLETECAAGTFREDLFSRLDVATITIPPLRARRDDIAPLAQHFLRLANEENHRAVHSITPEAMELLHAYAWPRNVRELRAAITRAVVHATGGAVTAEDLPERIRRRGEGTADEPGPAPDALKELRAGGTLQERLAQAEVKILLEVLESVGWKQIEAAKRLDISQRSLQYKLKEHGIKKRYE